MLFGGFPANCICLFNGLLVFCLCLIGQWYLSYCLTFSSFSKIILAITIGVKILGPVFGFMLGSFCTSLYVDPFMEADVTPKDPQWIGAWWLGNMEIIMLIGLVFAGL